MTYSRHIAILFLIHITASKSAKPANTGAQVYEVINEQARMDDKRIQTSPGLLPYGNPLAGNSLQNAKLHAQNQQAMFNAERVRQHRAQIQRWTQAPIKMDSYMKAYHESQENHQLAVEQQQSKDKKPSTRQPSTRQSTTRAPPRQRQRQRQDLRRNKGPDPLKITIDDAVAEKTSRNHRSQGSLNFHNRLQPNKFQTVFVAPGPTYDQGVTIKPNGNVGITTLQSKEEPKLFTEAIASNTKQVYPKQFQQMQGYESAQDIATLSALLRKQPQDQVNELNALIRNENGITKELETPIDLFFYLKDPKLPEQYDKSPYAQIPQYASAYVPEVKDHVPISEEIDDIEDPNKYFKKPYTEPILKTEDVTTNNVNFYSIKPTVLTQIDEKPVSEALKFEKHIYPHSGDTSERYLHHNAHFSGVQHLNEDGTGVSAYGDDLHYAANYEFGYHVRDHHTGNDFGHHEAKKGGETKGHYHVLLPDGRMQRVKYLAGPHGFHADISYESH